MLRPPLGRSVEVTDAAARELSDFVADVEICDTVGFIIIISSCIFSYVPVPSL
jgi:hypothetical protein